MTDLRLTMLAILVVGLTAALVRAAVAFQARDAKLTAEWVTAANAVHPASTLYMALDVAMANHFHVQSNQPEDEFAVPTRLEISPPPGMTVREVVYPAAVPFQVEGFDQPLLVFEARFAIGVALEVAGDVKPGVYPLSASLHYQACDNKICLAPTSLELKSEVTVVSPDVALTSIDNPIVKNIRFGGGTSQHAGAPTKGANTQVRTAAVHDCDIAAELQTFQVLGTAGGYLNAKDFIAFVDGAESGAIKRNVLEGKGPLVIVLLVIVGGVLLNLTPCVLPLVPINLAIIGAGAQAGSRGRGFALGGAYGLAMAVVYGALGLIVTLTSTAFGTINSTIWFNVAISVLFVILALAMFDVISIDFTKYQSKVDATKVAKRGTLALAFGMGCVTALLAGACVAPVVIQVVVYAGDQYARGHTIALALPFFLGLGMALPWPFAGAGLSFLPKPGMWMVRVKQAMGLFILFFAGYYAHLAYGIWRTEQLAGSATTLEQLEGGWTSNICAGFAQARAESKPILIDMWATWCKNCLAMDKTTFKDANVVNRLDGFVKVKFQAEDLDASPAREMLAHFKGIGLPTYAIIRPLASGEPLAQAPPDGL